ncbi:hypothetical protein NM22_01560 [Vibrio tubiashii]|nr:hypothetical protein NM22_01560 [Vibrio tubiashii]
MKIKTPLLAALVLGTSTVAVADVTITIPETVDILVVNEDSPKLTGSLFSNKKLALPDGENQILFKYKPYFDQGKERIILESDPILGTFTASNQALTFELPKYRNDVEASKKLPNLTWSLLDDKGQPIDIKQDKIIKQGMQIGRNYNIEVAEYNRKGGVAAVTSSTMVAVTLPANLDGKPMKVDATTAEEMLHFWYNKADATTRARFKDFVNQQ